MGKIICLMGKSSVGKDTIFKELIHKGIRPLKMIVPYTTRPIRAGEQDGVEYFFTDEEGFSRMNEEGKVIEHRGYSTVHGLWRYFTVNDSQMELEGADGIMIGTLEAYGKLTEYFGTSKIIPVLIELDDGIRLQRALNRERRQEAPKYEEMCRRFLADCEDFSEEKIAGAGITRRFYNRDLKKCIQEIEEYIKEECERGFS